MANAANQPRLQGVGCTREVHVLIPIKGVLKRVRGGLFSMRHNVVSSEITGRGHRFPNVPAHMTEDSAPTHSGFNRFPGEKFQGVALFVISQLYPDLRRHPA